MINPDISVVIPAQDEEESIQELCQWISRVMQTHGFSFEVIIIDDGSTDSTWQRITELNSADDPILENRLPCKLGSELPGVTL
jgi:glycosyltransferase involved in cell wall biosynthesis